MGLLKVFNYEIKVLLRSSWVEIGLWFVLCYKIRFDAKVVFT